jgi:ATP phosphoribosyltransferase
MLKIAVPNKGALAESAAQMLAEAGYRQRRNAKDLVTLDPDNDVEFFYLRPRDIAIYVGEGTLDVGITGRDLLLDSQAHATENISLGFGASTFRFAAPIGAMAKVEDLDGKRIATSYPGIVQPYLAERGVTADVVRLDGAVESSIRLGVADAIADVVETGSTLRQADLEVFGEPILSSEAVLITRNGAPQADGFAVF